MAPNIIERFSTKIDKSGDCWNWTASTNEGGYGEFRIKTRVYKAHRIAWEIEHGAIPIDMCICHHCDNPACVRPDHLFLGTRKDNMRDMVSKGRHKNNPDRGEDAYNSKLTESDVISIRDSSMNIGQLARHHSVARSTIRKILNRVMWNHI